MPPSLFSCALLLLGSASFCGAAVNGPYTPDAQTVHLFHLDETAGAVSFANAVPGGRALIPFDGNPTANHATNPQAVATTLSGAAAASAAFGKAASITAADLGLGLDWNGSGGFQMGLDGGTSPDALAHSALAGADGSFTLEALVKFPVLTGVSREIVCTDNSSTNSNNRGFQFRINTAGQLEFNFIGTGTATSVFPIPTTGSHGFVVNEWFHAALTYSAGTSRFYWTRLADSSGAANLIGTSTSETTSGTITGPLVVGNEARSNGASSEGLQGSIDEVRLSRVARAASEFLFTPSAPVEPVPDNLPDAWELAWFGNLDQTETADPDGDGTDNLTEYNAGAVPINRASTGWDADADALPDAWELAHFGNAERNGGADDDGDGFGNLQEFQSGTNPSEAASRPAGTAVRLVPLDDGDPATSEFGYAGSSAINTVSFARSSLKTVGNQQFISWYGRDQYDAAAPFNNTIWIGRRTVGSSRWEVFRHPSFTANNIADGHDVIAYGIDGDGFMHVSWGMHGDAFHYAKSTAPVTGTAAIGLGPDTTMTGRENTVTYPQFLLLPDGDLLFLFREVASGNGDTFLNRYDTATGTWDNVHRSGSTQLPFLKGTGWTPNYNAYPNMPQLGGDGDDLTLTWCWRYEPVGNDSPGGFDGYQTNNNIAYARSPDGGVTWQRSDGTPYALPVSRNGESGNPATAAEHIVTIPEGSSLINQAGTCLDRAGNPVTATWWAPDTQALPVSYRRQYMIVFKHGNGTWQTRRVSSRTNDPAGTRYDESAVRNLGRPIVVCDDTDRLIVAYRDNAGTNGLTIVHSLPRAQDPDRLVWISFDLTSENLGNFEPIIDHERWDRDRSLQFLYQASAGEGYTPLNNNAARVSVLEWEAASYFAHQPQPVLAMNASGPPVTLTCPSQPSWTYRLYSSTALEDWSLVETRRGTGNPLVFTPPVSPGEPRRFWQIDYQESAP